MENKKKRGCNYTGGEKEILLRLVKNYQNFIESKETSARMNLKKREIWGSVCQQYNAVAVSGFRTWQQLRHLYENIKQRSKKNIARENVKSPKGRVKPTQSESNIKEQYFEAKLRNAKLENRYIINKNRMEINKYKIEMQYLKLRLEKLKFLKLG